MKGKTMRSGMLGSVTGAALVLMLAATGCASVGGNGLSSRSDTQIGLVSAAEGEVRNLLAELERNPKDASLRRGLAQAYAKSGRMAESRDAYRKLMGAGAATPSDHLDLVRVALYLDDISTARTAIGAVPGDRGGARRAMLDAMIADHAGAWARADAGYAAAARTSEDPAEVLNNWGVSRLARGDAAGAEATFAQAVAADKSLFVAYNNLAIARAMRGNYRAPSTSLTRAQDAMLMHNMGLVAERRGDIDAARKLFAAAVEKHPQTYAGAATRLARLN